MEFSKEYIEQIVERILLVWKSSVVTEWKFINKIKNVESDYLRQGKTE